MIFWQLFLSYLKIGFFGFGGGYAMLSLIHAEVVVRHGWLSAAEFADIVAVSQITPGPIAINSATYIGYTVGLEHGGIVGALFGALLTTTAVSLPALSLMILITRFFLRLKNNPLVKGAMLGLRPVVVGLIASAVLLLLFPRSSDGADQAFSDTWSWLLFGGVLIGQWRHINPILLILLSAVAGIVLYL